MWRDSIVEEIRTIREEHTRQYNYDIRAIFTALKEEEKKERTEDSFFSAETLSSLYNRGRKAALTIRKGFGFNDGSRKSAGGWKIADNLR